MGIKADDFNPFSGDGVFTKNSFLGDLPVIGTLGKSLGIFESDADRQQQELQKRFAEMQQAYGQYRPMAAQARMGGLENQLALFDPINQMLTRMYGPEASFDTSLLLRNPMPEGMTSVGAPPREKK